MPFQVVYSSRISAPGVITYFTAGEDQAALCSVNNTLEATVIGDTEGHTFLWEQMSGNPIVWTSPTDQLLVTYNNPSAIYDDKVFRFWIDKGKPDQQYDEITVFGTPTAKAVFNYGSDQATYASLGSTYNCRAPEASMSLTFIGSPQEGSESDESSFALMWGLPECDSDEILQFGIQEASSPWSEIAIVPKTGNTYSPIVPNRAYRVVAYYRERNSAISAYTSNTVYSTTQKTLLNKTQEISDTAEFNHGTASIDHLTIPHYSVLVRTKTLVFESTEAYFSSVGTGTIEYLTTPHRTVLERKRTEVTYGPSDAHFNSSGTGSTDYITIPVYTVLDLTGGGIGGGG